MIDLEKAKKEFEKYVSNYDLNNPNIKRKVEHSLRVMDYSKSIAENLNLNEEQTKLATLIGLLHDIARFEQWKRFETYNDKKSIDHGDLAIEILEENNFIRKFIEDDKYDPIIKVAIKNHNKYKIEGLEGEEFLQAKIIKDADKIDIFYQIATQYFKPADVVEKQEISDDFLDQFKQEKCILKKVNQTELEGLVLVASFIYDVYFDYSLKIIKDEEYIERMFAQFDFKNLDVKEKINFIINQAQKYIKRRTCVDKA